MTPLFIFVTRFSTQERVRVNIATIATYEDTDCQGKICFADGAILYTEENAAAIDALIAREKGEVP